MFALETCSCWVQPKVCGLACGFLCAHLESRFNNDSETFLCSVWTLLDTLQLTIRGSSGRGTLRPQLQFSSIPNSLPKAQKPHKPLVEVMALPDSDFPEARFAASTVANMCSWAGGWWGRDKAAAEWFEGAEGERFDQKEEMRQRLGSNTGIIRDQRSKRQRLNNLTL